MVKHSSAVPKVPRYSRIQGSWIVMKLIHASYSKRCRRIGFLSPLHKNIPGSYSIRAGGNAGNSVLSFQPYVVVHYTRYV